MKIKADIEIAAALKGMSMNQLAHKAGILPQNLSAIKSRGTCSALTACKIASALGVDVTEIIEREN